jgi:Secretion system C-terminal sorting domain
MKQFFPLFLVAGSAFTAISGDATAQKATPTHSLTARQRAPRTLGLNTIHSAQHGLHTASSLGSVLNSVVGKHAGTHSEYVGDRGTAPVNDDCAGAVPLTIGATCTPTSGTVLSATQSMAPIQCFDAAESSEDDVWYSFVANATTATITLTCNATFDGVIDLLSGACNGTSIGCADDVITGNDETLNATGLTAGATYHFRVYDYTNTTPADPTFTVCVFATPATPPNDECADAVVQTLSVPGSVTVNGDNTGATDSEGLGTNTVWESFTISQCANVTIDYCGTSPVFTYAAFDVIVDDCVFTTVIAASSTPLCTDGNQSFVFTNLPAGTYIYPVAQAANATGAYTLTFTATACSGIIPPNDECADAVIQNLSVPGSVSVNGDNTGATNTEGLPVNAVWEGFTITDCANVTIAYCGTTPAFGQFFISLVSDCLFTTITDSTSTSACVDGNPTVTFANLPAGTYLYPVAQTALATGAYTISFTATACGGGNPPVNDQCASVVPVDLSVGSSINFSGDNTGATITNDYVPGSLLDAEGIASVWHAFTTTECANVTVSYCSTLPAFGNVWVLLSYSCPADTLMFYSDFNDTLCGNGNFEIFYQNLPAGTWYLPVLSDAVSGAEGLYSIDVTADVCLPGPVNDNCAAAINLNVNLTCMPTTGSVENASQSLPASACNGSTGNANDDVWYSFVATGPNETVSVTGSDSLDAVVQLYSGACGSFVELACADSTFEGELEEIVSGSLVEGTTYYVRVYDYYNGMPPTTAFDICITGDIGSSVAEGASAVFGIRPNPTEGLVTIDFRNAQGAVTVELLDVAGRVVLMERRSVTAGGSMTLNVSSAVPAGLYTVRLTTPEQRAEQRLLVR